MPDESPPRRPGERLTRQRQAIFRLFASQGHLRAEDILTALRPEFPKLNSSTVYRELLWLKDRGLISETDMGGGIKVYERVTEPPHHHLICLHCGCIADLDNRYFDSLRQALREEFAFWPRLEHFAIFGSCAACLAKMNKQLEAIKC